MRHASASCLALALLVISLAPKARADADPWFGRDKMLHFAGSAALATGGYAVGAWIWEEPEPALLLGAGISLGAGVTKELLDLGGMGHASWRDLAWDVVGTGVGLALSWGIHRLFLSKPADARAAGGVPPGKIQNLQSRGPRGQLPPTAFPRET